MKNFQTEEIEVGGGGGEGEWNFNFLINLIDKFVLVGLNCLC